MTNNELAEQWNTYGNLMFYQGFSSHFFYFNWLLTDYQGSRGKKYTERANKIGQEAQAKLNTNNFLSSEYNSPEEVIARFTPLLSTLKNAITYERQNEIAFFQERYKQVTSTFTDEEIKQNPEIMELSDVLKSAIDCGQFDYKRFNTLINFLIQGTQNARATIAYETQHLDAIEKGVKDLREARLRQVAGLGQTRRMEDEKIQKMLENTDKRLNRQIKVSYLDSHNLSGVRGSKVHFKNVLSSDVKLAHWITSRIQAIWEDEGFREHIRNYIQKNNIIYNNNYAAVESEITEFIINSIQEEALQHIPEILHDKYKHLRASDLVKRFNIDEMFNIRQQYRIEGWYANYGQFGHRLKFFDQLEQNMEPELATSAELYDSFNELITELNRAKRKSEKNPNSVFAVNELKKLGVYKEDIAIRELIRKLTALSKKYEQALRQTEKFKKKYDSQWDLDIKDDKQNSVTISIVVDDDGKVHIENLSKIKSLSSYQNLMGQNDIKSTSIMRQVATLKTKANQKLKEELNTVIKNAASTQQSTEEVRTALRRGFERMRVSVGGPALSELLEGIQFRKHGENLSIQWVGKKDSKNDVVITLRAPTGDDFLMTEQVLVNNINEQIELEMDKRVQSIQDAYINDFSKSFQHLAGTLNQPQTSSQREVAHRYDVMKKAFLQNHISNPKYPTIEKIQQKYEESEKLLEEYLSTLPSKERSEKELAIRKSLAESLGNSFYVSTTVKTYNQYQNDIGFVGGSLGANVVQQLTNLQDIFQSAGIKLPKADFDWLLGAIINCSPISVIKEQDKHTIEYYLGSMAAFALFDEGAAEAQIVNMKDLARPKTVPKILHLYKVNGIYVPGSFVLQETYKELAACVDQMNFAVESTHRGAGVTIVNRMNYHDLPNQGATWKTLQTQTPWEDVSHLAEKKVEIKILFLAKLMDIMKGINETLGNIELPT